MATYTADDLIRTSDACVREWRKRKRGFGIDSFLKKQAKILADRIGPTTEAFIKEAKSLVETQLAMIKLAEETRKRISKDGITDLGREVLSGDSLRGIRIPDYTRYLTYPVSNVRAAAFERIEPGHLRSKGRFEPIEPSPCSRRGRKRKSKRG